MKTLQLLPHTFKKIGWLIMVPAAIVFILYLTGAVPEYHLTLPVLVSDNQYFLGPTQFLKTTPVDLTFNLPALVILVGGMLVGFSQEKVEDEYVSFLRLRAVFWALKISFVTAFVFWILIYGTLFLYAMLLLMFLPLFLYIFRFEYLLRHAK